MKESSETLPGLQVQQVGLKELSDFAPQIRGLRYNALDTGKNRAPYSQRKADLKEVKDEFLHSAQHEAAFVALHEGKVVGFLSVDKTPQDKMAVINDLWTSLPDRSQKSIVGKLFVAARETLTARGYVHLEAKPEAASHGFDVMSASSDFYRFVRVERGEDSAHVPQVSDAPSVATDAAPDSIEDDPDTHLEKAM